MPQIQNEPSSSIVSDGLLFAVDIPTGATDVNGNPVYVTRTITAAQFKAYVGGIGFGGAGTTTLTISQFQLPGVPDDQAVMAALATTTAPMVDILFPPGTYTFAAPITISGRAVSFRGVHKSVVTINVAHAQIALTITPPSGMAKSLVSGITFVATNASSAGCLDVAYPSSNWPSNFDTVEIKDCDFLYSASGHFNNAISLAYCWRPLISRCNANFAPPGTAPVSGSATITMTSCVDAHIWGIMSVFHDDFLLQAGYCEGVKLEQCTILGNWAYRPSATFDATRAPGQFKMDSFRCVDCEIGTELGAFVAIAVHDAEVYGNNFSRSNLTGNSWIAQDLTDCPGWNSHDNNYILTGTTNPASGTAIRLTSGPLESANYSTFINEQIALTSGPMIIFGPGTYGNVALLARPVNASDQVVSNGTAAFVDQGTNNYIEWITATGARGSTNGFGWEGVDGSPVLQLSPVAGATSYVDILNAGTAGVATARVASAASAANFALEAHGQGGVVTVGNDVNVVAAFESPGTVATPNIALVLAGAPGEPVVIGTQGPGTLGIGLQFQMENGGPLLLGPNVIVSGLPNSPNGLPAGVVWEDPNTGVLSVVRQSGTITQPGSGEIMLGGYPILLGGNPIAVQ